jgi:hypothetical protein
MSAHRLWKLWLFGVAIAKALRGLNGIYSLHGEDKRGSGVAR